MKTNNRPLLVALIAALLFCYQSASANEAALTNAKQCIETKLAAIATSLEQAAQSLSGTGLTGPEARQALAMLHASSKPFAIDEVTIDSKGTIVEAYPERWRSVIGTNIMDQSHVARVLQSGKPLMSETFTSVEGIEAVDAQYPVVDEKGRFTGSVSLLFRPALLLAECIEPAVAGTTLSIWALGSDGTILYDRMPEQIGLKLFTAPLYKPFASLQQLGRRIEREQEGRGTYRFYLSGTQKVVSKEAVWTTVSLFGTQWRLVAYRTLDARQAEPASN